MSQNPKPFSKQLKQQNALILIFCILVPVLILSLTTFIHFLMSVILHWRHGIVSANLWRDFGDARDLNFLRPKVFYAVLDRFASIVPIIVNGTTNSLNSFLKLDLTTW